MAKRKPIKQPRELQYDDWQRVIDAAGTEGELQCVLLITAAIEHALGTLLLGFFTQDSQRSTKLLHGVLSSTKNRADIACSLGLISAGCKCNIGAILDVRNEFAHSSIHVSFDDKRIIDYCNSIKPPRIPSGIKFGSRNSSSVKHSAGERARIRFISVATPIALTLMQEAKNVRPMRIRYDEWDR